MNSYLAPEMLRPGFVILSYNRLHYAGGYILAALVLSACASTPMTNAIISEQPQYLGQSTELSDVPFFPQDEYQCGPAALATVLGYSGINVTPKELSPKVYLPERKGTLQIELMSATRRYGRLPYLLEPSLEELLIQVKAGKPVLVFQNLGVEWYPQWHFAVVVGYDLESGKLLLRSGKIEKYQVNLQVFERTWQRSGYWAFVVLTPGELPAGGQQSSYFHTVADYERTRPPGNAIKAYRAGLARWPNSRLLGMGLGNSYYQSGNLSKAEESYTGVVSKHPDYAPAHNNLAQIMMEQGKLNNAKKHAEHAVALGDSHQKLYQSTLDDILSRMSE